jgi:hypothetical protein
MQSNLATGSPLNQEVIPNIFRAEHFLVKSREAVPVSRDGFSSFNVKVKR